MSALSAGVISTFLFAFFGGLVVNFLALVELRHTPRSERPETFRDPLYCAHFFGLPMCGGVLALAYSGSGVALTSILAINIGASTPLILKSFAATLPPTDRRIG